MNPQVRQAWIKQVTIIPISYLINHGVLSVAMAAFGVLIERRCCLYPLLMTDPEYAEKYQFQSALLQLLHTGATRARFVSVVALFRTARPPIETHSMSPFGIQGGNLVSYHLSPKDFGLLLLEEVENIVSNYYKKLSRLET